LNVADAWFNRNDGPARPPARRILALVLVALVAGHATTGASSGEVSPWLVCLAGLARHRRYR
jgi:hypothetical protein